VHAWEAGHLGVLAQAWQRVGWSGVDLFFVLSGFLVGGLLFRESRQRSGIDARRFLLRRGLKIWPAYYVCLAVTFAAAAWNDGLAQAAGAVLPNLAHLQNYVWATGANLPGLKALSPTWSLAVEEHFYLALTALLVCCTRWRGRRSADPFGFVPWASVALMVVCLALRVQTRVATPEASRYATLFPTHLRLDGLFLGVALGYLYHLRPPSYRALSGARRTLILAAAILLSPLAVFTIDSDAMLTVGLTTTALGYACLLVATLETRPDRTLWSWLIHGWAGRALAWIGFYSYSIYLWHWAVMRLLLTPSRATAAQCPPELWYTGWTAAQVLLSVALGVVGGRLVELPFLRLRDRLAPPRASVFDTASSPQRARGLP
jgi:peptidoglycan/LPS O-acetylase OafA/YrhL